MKVTLVFATILALSTGLPAFIPSVLNERQCNAPDGGGLQPAFDEMFALIPVDKLLELVLDAISNDEEVQEVMEFLQSKDFQNIASAIENSPEFYKLMEFACTELYFDVYYYLNTVGEIIGLPSITRPPFNYYQNTIKLFKRPGLKGLFYDILDILPLEAMKELFYEKMETDEYVKKGMETLKSEEFNQIVNTVEQLKEFQEALDRLREKNIDVDTIIALIKKYFNWN